MFPDRVAWAVRGRGPRSAILAQGVETCAAPEGEPAWRGSIETLAAILDASAKPRPELAILLSGRFVRPLLVPWPAEIESDAEGVALAGHHFHRVFGDDSRGWQIAFDREASGPARLACAVEREFLDALRATASAAGVRLASVAPLLVSAFNLWCRHVGRGATLFVFAEQGRYCAATLRDGAWVSLRYGRLGSEGGDSLAEAIEREAALAGDAELRVLSYAPELGDFAPSPDLAPRLTRLALDDRSGLPSPIDPRAEFAVGGLL